MKKLFAVIIMAMFVGSIYAQQNEDPKKDPRKMTETKIPGAVEKAFSSNFMNAKDVRWSMEKNGQYEADFKMNDKKSSAIFDDMGNMVESETTISEDQLPMAVKNAFNKNYPDYKIKRIEQKNAMNNNTYIIKAEKGMESHEFVYDSQGNMTKMGKWDKEKDKKEDNKGW